MAHLRTCRIGASFGCEHESERSTERWAEDFSSSERKPVCLVLRLACMRVVVSEWVDHECEGRILFGLAECLLAGPLVAAPLSSRGQEWAQRKSPSQVQCISCRFCPIASSSTSSLQNVLNEKWLVQPKVLWAVLTCPAMVPGKAKEPPAGIFLTLSSLDEM